MTPSTDVADALAAGQALAGPHTLEDGSNVRVFTIPDGHHLETVDPADYTDTPSTFRQRSINAFDAESFIDAIHAFRTATPRVFIDPVQFTAVAILNDDEPADDVPGRGNRAVRLTLTHTPEWTSWTERDGALADQESFVEFIEDHMPQIASPPAADLYEIAQSLQATTSATFRSAVRLQSGTRQFHYSEDVAAVAGQSGDIEIPETFLLGLSPWVGCETVPVTARLRFRIGTGGLMLGYRLVGVEQVLTAAFTNLTQPIRDTMEFCVNGTP